MKMHNPPHPGEVLRALCLEPLNLTVTDAAIARRKPEGAVQYP
jgi:antitoxin HigA-1